MKNKPLLGHLSAMFTIFLWGSTFISTKILLTAFSPTEILFFRFFRVFGSDDHLSSHHESAK